MFRTYANVAVVESFRESLDEEVWRSVSVEFPDAEHKWPGLFVNVRPTTVKWSGMQDPEPSFLEDGTADLIREGYFEAVVELRFYALSSQERDKMWDDLVEVVMFSDVPEDGLANLINRNDWVAITVNPSTIETTGLGTTSVPWSADVMGYEGTIVFDITGEFFADTQTRNVVRLSTVHFKPWTEEEGIAPYEEFGFEDWDLELPLAPTPIDPEWLTNDALHYDWSDANVAATQLVSQDVEFIWSTGTIGGDYAGKTALQNMTYTGTTEFVDHLAQYDGRFVMIAALDATAASQLAALSGVTAAFDLVTDGAEYSLDITTNSGATDLSVPVPHSGMHILTVYWTGHYWAIRINGVGLASDVLIDATGLDIATFTFNLAGDLGELVVVPLSDDNEAKDVYSHYEGSLIAKWT